MNTSELRSVLHESIENIDDSDLLLAIKELADRKYTASDQPKLTAGQIARIEESRRQIAKGEFLTNEEAEAIIDKWLSA